MTENELIDLLAQLKITYQRFNHPPVYTCEQADFYLKNAPGAGTKNLFLCAEKSDEIYLLMVDESKRVDINGLARQLGIKKLHFGSSEKMVSCLGVEPGAVTLLAVVNDTQKRVNILIDRDLWLAESVQCHPLTNTATLVIGIPDIERFLNQTGHSITLVEVPVKM